MKTTSGLVGVAAARVTIGEDDAGMTRQSKKRETDARRAVGRR